MLGFASDNRYLIDCAGNTQRFNNTTEFSHGINAITSKYFTVDSVTQRNENEKNIITFNILLSLIGNKNNPPKLRFFIGSEDIDFPRSYRKYIKELTIISLKKVGAMCDYIKESLC